ncbi:hypothetical protein XENORESO_005698, partial [Xenotaenia resolanae]
ENSGCPSGPDVSCITCQKEVPFSDMKVHRVSCNGTTMQESDRDELRDYGEGSREPTRKTDSVPVRPETSEPTVESSVAPVVAYSEEFDPDNG